ncbi:MAG: Helix-turn-helix domain [Gammaproteobacteria bacterium]|jgi:transcriptional regulator with XRE-family HTH domain|nr:Helix-turn-helix domain [Gammaproteobacteria bacterium]
MKLLRLGARLRAARKAAGFKTAKAFLKKHHVPASTYSQHESGARTPDDQALKFYAKVFEVDFNWLKKGKGQPFKKITAFKKETLAEESIELSRKNPIDEALLKKILTRYIKIHASPFSLSSIHVITEASARAYCQHTNPIRFRVKNKN